MIGRPCRQNCLALEPVHQARRVSEAKLGISAVKQRRIETLARLQRIREIEIVESADYADLIVRGVFNDEFPVAAPPQGAEPHLPMLFVCCASCIDGEPRICLPAGVTSTAFQYFLARVNGFLRETSFSSPIPVQI